MTLIRQSKTQIKMTRSSSEMFQVLDLSKRLSLTFNLDNKLYKSACRNLTLLGLLNPGIRHSTTKSGL